MYENLRTQNGNYSLLNISFFFINDQFFKAKICMARKTKKNRGWENKIFISTLYSSTKVLCLLSTKQTVCQF